MRRAAIILLPPALLLGACTGADTIAPPAQTELRLAMVSGDVQEGLAGTTLPEPLVVRLTDRPGEPYRGLPGAVANWVVTTGGGNTFVAATQTDARGETRNWWTLGEPGAQVLEVRAVHPTTGERRV